MSFALYDLQWVPRTDDRPTAYELFLAAREVGDSRGFPGARQIQQWIPGVSTPDGRLLISASTLIPVLGQHTPAIDGLVQGAFNSLMLAVTAAPMATVWAGYTLVSGKSS